MLISIIKHVLFPDKKYLQSKFNDYRSFSFIMSFVGSFTCAGLWIWDYVIDPIGAESTFFLRLMMLSIGAIYTIILKKVDDNRWIPFATLVTAISWEIIFIIILNRLDTGMIYGISGFMFFILLPLILMQGQSARFNIFYMIVIAAIPHIVAVAGLAKGFQHKHYAVLIWIEVVMGIIVQIAIGFNYVMRYNSKLQLELAATTDSTTGISNRGHFMTCLENEMKKAQSMSIPLTLILLDMDNFKRINDNHGHPAGDRVLKQLADICKHNAGDSGMIGRMGGEEFGMVVSGINTQAAVILAEHIRQQVESNLITTNKGVIKVTCSLGIANMKNHESMEGLYERADKALYQAKAAGRNRVCLGE